MNTTRRGFLRLLGIGAPAAAVLAASPTWQDRLGQWWKEPIRKLGGIRDWVSYRSIGDREDLADLIYDIDPTKTPFMAVTREDRAAALKADIEFAALSGKKQRQAN